MRAYACPECLEDVGFGGLESHLRDRHVGALPPLVAWTCGRCPFLTPHFDALAWHALQEDHDFGASSVSLDQGSILRVSQCLSRLQRLAHQSKDFTPRRPLADHPVQDPHLERRSKTPRRQVSSRHIASYPAFKRQSKTLDQAFTPDRQPCKAQSPHRPAITWPEQIEDPSDKPDRSPQQPTYTHNPYIKDNGHPEWTKRGPSDIISDMHESPKPATPVADSESEYLVHSVDDAQSVPEYPAYSVDEAQSVPEYPAYSVDEAQSVPESVPLYSHYLDSLADVPTDSANFPPTDTEYLDLTEAVKRPVMQYPPNRKINFKCDLYSARSHPPESFVVTISRAEWNNIASSSIVCKDSPNYSRARKSGWNFVVKKLSEVNPHCRLSNVNRTLRFHREGERQRSADFCRGSVYCADPTCNLSYSLRLRDKPSGSKVTFEVESKKMLECPQCRVELDYGGLQRHLAELHLGSFALQTWRCPCGFSAASFETLAWHCLSQKHSTNGAVSVAIDKSAILRAFACLDSLIQTESPRKIRPADDLLESIRVNSAYPKVGQDYECLALEYGRVPSEKVPLILSSDRASPQELPSITDPVEDLQSGYDQDTGQRPRITSSAIFDQDPVEDQSEQNTSAYPDNYYMPDSPPVRKRRRSERTESRMTSPGMMAANTATEFSPPNFARFPITLAREEWDMIEATKVVDPDRRKAHRYYRASRWAPAFLPRLAVLNRGCTLSATRRHLRIVKWVDFEVGPCRGDEGGGP